MPTTVIRVGGLLAVGFDATETHLLILTHNGRTLHRTADGVRVARNAETGEPWDDEENPGAAGIGPLVGVRVPVTLFDGGELRVASPSGKYTLRCTPQEVEITTQG